MKRFEGRPIFICGWPRGGTRMIADLVSSHPTTIPASEVPRTGLLAVVETVRVFDEGFAKKVGRPMQWRKIRQDWFLNAIANTYTRRSEGRRFVNKTPSTEFSWQEIVESCPDAPPLFVYCARHPMKVIRSLLNMSWNSASFSRNLERMHASADILDAMRSAGTDVLLTQLDKVEASEREGFTERLMAFLELDMTPEISAYVEAWPVAQPAVKVLAGQPVEDFSEAERDRILKSRTYQDLCMRFGYEP